MNIIPSIKFFIRDSRAVGVLLICSTAASLVVANSSCGSGYLSFWEQEIITPAHGLHLPGSLLHFVNDALMSLFFFSAGLEIKREVLNGELQTIKKSMLPVISAIGGMLLPAIIYLAFCHHSHDYKGWGIPMATDIAFSLGALSLLGKRAPLSMRIFLTAIAIIDDIGGILAIAVFYAGHLNWLYSCLAAMIVVILLALNYFRVTRISIYLVTGLLLWYFVYNSGIHATIAGVLLAMVIPSSCIHRLEQSLRVPVNFIILPLFALANTAIILPAQVFPIISSPVHWGIFLGLFLGKPIGIFLATYVAVKLKIVDLPGSLTHKQVLGMGMMAGIGFSVSIFIATLAFPGTQTLLIAKLAVLNASLASGICGYCYLRFTRKKQYGRPTLPS